MPRSFRPVVSSLGTSGPLLLIEEGSDIAPALTVVTSFYDVPSEWVPGSGYLNKHIGEMQEHIIKDLAKQGWEYDGGPFDLRSRRTGAVTRYPGGFAIQGPGVAIEGETGLLPNDVPYMVSEIEGVRKYFPVQTEKIRYYLTARYRHRPWHSEILVRED